MTGSTSSSPSSGCSRCRRCSSSSKTTAATRTRGLEDEDRADHAVALDAEARRRRDAALDGDRLHRRRAAGRGRLARLVPFLFDRKALSDKDGTFGKGDPRGVAAPEAGNNAAAGGALVPMLALGVPGSGTTAVLLAMLLALNITPGPLLFQQNPDVVWGLIAALFIGNFMLLLMNIPMVGLFVRVLLIPPKS
jgi:hypothetical protein